MPNIIVGIDPGKKGAVAFLDVEKNSVAVIDMPEDEYELVDTLNAFKNKIYRVFLEKQQPFPRQGLVSTFSLGKHYGALITIMKLLKLPYEEIPPHKWQRVIIGNGKRQRKQSKKLSLMKAKALYPNVEIKNQHGRSDAILIAEYGRRILFGRKNG